jgi:hypothetical protein
MEIPQISKRNEFGLKEGYDYRFTSDNLVDWKAMIPAEHLVINKSYENQIVEKLGKPLSEASVLEVEDHQRLMLLSATRYLLDLRGYSKVEYSRPVYGSDGAVVVECKITFLPNFETEMREVVFSGIGEATKNNAAPIGKNKMSEWAFYLAATAENRALIRCLRNFLKIKILGKDEFSNVETTSPETQPIAGFSPLSLLESEMKKKEPEMNFEILKRTVISAYKDKMREDPSAWKTIKDICPNDIYTLINLIRDSKKRT